MTAAIIVAIYILGVFAARYLNRVAIRVNSDIDVLPFMWLLSALSTISFLIAIVIMLKPFKVRNNWFTGKYWEDEK